MARVFPHVCIRDRGEELFLSPKSYHVRMVALGTAVGNAFLLFMAMLSSYNKVRSSGKSYSFVRMLAVSGFLLSYDVKVGKLCFH